MAFTDPFLVGGENWFPRGVFEDHPHKGMETVTFMFDGVLEHFDNLGNRGQAGAGDVMWMTAGRGLIHNEVPAKDTTVHLMQLWVNLPAAAKDVPAAHQLIKADEVPVRREPGAELRVYSGASGDVVSPTRNHVPVTLVDVRLQPGASVQQTLPADYNGFVWVLAGAMRIGATGEVVKAGEVGWLERSAEASSVALNADTEGARALLIAGLPLREPIAAGGPFVMNTEEQLQAAFAEFRRVGQDFGK